MSPAVLALLAGAALALEGSSAVRAVPLSHGSGLRAVGKLTFDRKLAAQGGYVFAAPKLTLEDAPAIRLSVAVLTSGAGPLSPAGRLARRHQVPALSLPGASWERGALVVAKPAFGPPRQAGATSVLLAERVEPRRLLEGEAVAVDPLGALIPIDPSEQAFELELAQALRAFDGLRDLQALLQWYDARPPSAALAARLVEELAARAAVGAATPAELARLRRSLETGLDDAGKRAVAAAAEAAARRAEGSAAVKPAAKKLDAAQAEAALAAAGAAKPARTEIPAALYDRFVSQSGLREALERVADDASLGLRRKDKRLSELWAAAPLDPGSPLAAELIGRLPAFERVTICGPEGCRENVPKAEALAATKDVWSWSWSGEALGARKREGRPFVSPALTAEPALPAEVSVLAVSRDPVDGTPGRVHLLCAAGEPDALSSGEELILDAKTFKPVGARSSCLSAERAERAAKLALALDDAAGRAVELTLVFAGGKPFARSWR